MTMVFFLSCVMQTINLVQKIIILKKYAIIIIAIICYSYERIIRRTALVVFVWLESTKG